MYVQLITTTAAATRAADTPLTDDGQSSDCSLHLLLAFALALPDRGKWPVFRMRASEIDAVRLRRIVTQLNTLQQAGGRANRLGVAQLKR
jgi:hypothetical protein